MGDRRLLRLRSLNEYYFVNQLRTINHSILKIETKNG